MIKGTLILTFDVEYDPSNFDPNFQFQLGWKDSESGEISDNDNNFQTEPISEEKISDLKSSNPSYPNHETWRIKASIKYDENLIDPYTDDINIYEFDQGEDRIVPESQSMHIINIKKREFYTETMSPSKKSKSIANDSKIKSSWIKLVFIAVIIYISSFLSGILTLFLSVIYHDHLNYLLKLIHINIKNYYLGEYIICIFSFFLGIYLGFYINKLLLIKFKVISKEDINKLTRINRFRIKL